MAYTPLPLLDIASRNWWALLIRGIAAIAFAIMAFIWPGLTVAVLVLLWGAWAIVDGIFAIVGGARSRWWSLLFLGVVGVAAGLVALFLPGMTALILLMFIAAWAIVRGIFEIAAAIRLRRELTGEWALILSGILSIAFGVLLMLYPGAGALAVVWLIAVWSLVIGILLISLAFRVRSIDKYRRGTRIDLDRGTTPPGVTA